MHKKCSHISLNMKRKLFKWMILNVWLISAKLRNQDLQKHWKKTNNKNKKLKKKKIILVKSKNNLKPLLVLKIHSCKQIKSMLDQNKQKILILRSFVVKTSHFSMVREWEIHFSHLKLIIPYLTHITDGNLWQWWIR